MPRSGSAKRLAVLIDADNTSAGYAPAIFEEIVKLGEATVRRVYGDFSGTRLKSWNDAIKSLAILQHQQRSNSTGKNASDIALVIDAMDLMHKGTLDGFCLVSSDSDFTRLAQRLREEGLEVVGFGERKAVEAFRNACNRFIYVENLVDPESKKGKAARTSARKGPARKGPPAEAVDIIARAVPDSDGDGWVRLSEVGNQIQKAVPDFDARSYGYQKLSLLVADSDRFDMRKDDGGVIHVRLKPSP